MRRGFLPFTLLDSLAKPLANTSRCSFSELSRRARRAQLAVVPSLNRLL